MKFSHVVSLLVVAALAAVWAKKQLVEIRVPNKIYARQGYIVRFNFGIRSFDRNVSLNESLVEVRKFNTTELPTPFLWNVKPFGEEETGAAYGLSGAVKIRNASCAHNGKYQIKYRGQRKGKTFKIRIA